MRVSILLASTLIFTNVLISCNAFANTSGHQALDNKLAMQKVFIANINQCNAPKKLSKMLDVALKNIDNYVVKATNAGHFEEIMLNNPSCFITAINELPKEKCLQVESVFIQETFFYPREDIINSLTKASGYTKSCIAS
jgi:hypothetical protein